MATKNTRVQVEKKGNENSGALLKRFTRKVSGSGLLRKARSLRFMDRPLSDFKKRQQALRKLANKEKLEKLEKLGKAPVRGRGRRR